MKFDCEQFLANHEMLLAAWGERLPAWDEDTKRRADAAVEGRELPRPYSLITNRPSVDFLALAYRDSGEERYAEAARRDLLESLKPFEKPVGKQTLSIATYCGNCRSGSFLGTLPIFLGSASFDDAFIDEMVAETTRLLNFLHDHISTGNMNWRIANADGLALGGLRLGFLPDGPHWAKLGIEALNDASHRQILPDGAHIERNPHYHLWMNCVFDAYEQLGSNRPETGLRIDAGAVARMWDYALCSTRPNGDENALHDSQAIRVGRMEDNVPLRLRAAFRRRVGLPDELPPLSRYFGDAGQVTLRDGWSEDATYLTFDATNWHTDHCHLSRNAVQVHAHGRTLLHDPGWLSDIGTYTDRPIGLYGKATRAHNTLNLNGWNQSTVDPSRTRFRSADGIDVVSNDYEGGYWPGEFAYGYVSGMGKGLYASHHRTLVWLRGRAIVVWDSLYRDQVDGELPSLEMNWNFCEGAAPRIDEAARRVVTQHEAGNALMLFPLLPDGLEWNVYEGSEQPLRGWACGPAFSGTLVPVPQLCLRLPRMDSRWAEITTVIVPFPGPEAPALAAEAVPTAPDNVGTLKLNWPDGSADELYWYYRLDLMIGERFGMDTDASMVHLSRDPAGEVTGGHVIEGSYLRPFVDKQRDTPTTFAF